MNLSIHVDSEAAPDLYRWLASDPEVARGITPAAESSRGDMGLAFDILNLVVPNAIALSSLITSILMYRASREESGTRVPTVRIEYSEKYVVVDGDVQVVVEQLMSRSATGGTG
ncbi:hypothetical protein SAMN04244553_1987 [Nocardia amikacinitolerans]|uniref:Uncharacterized protein n=1 Tax=Nocardia amikacinitolerans TaxID=756689 RepID=A0A285LAL2_9NOCA|nr:hypothetical protein [Nocardia amikacinitolerans]MCP2297005.1 hypothetical protein [Nocardia amikacinitolerans]SNY80421.1 hypothetical protein SAMN04244553_1987 [Nocardia amikacinitolerans]